MQTKHLCVLVHIWTNGEVVAPLNRFKPSSKIFLWTVPRRCFFCGSFVLFLSCFCYAFIHACLLMPCGHLLGKADLLALVFDVYCDVVTFLLVSWVRCGAWFYRFLIFAIFLTFMHTCTDDQWLPNIKGVFWQSLRQTAQTATTECACALSCYNWTAGD